MNRMQLLTIAAAVAASMALSGAVSAQWQDIPSSPRIAVPGHGVEVSIAAVHFGMLNLDYVQIRERTLGTTGPWTSVYGQQYGTDIMDEVVKQHGGYVQYINSLLPAYNQFLATRYPPASDAGPVFGTGALDQLNKALYESFRFLAQTNGQITVGPK